MGDLGGGSQTGAEQRCPTCGTRIRAGEPAQSCSDCHQAHHKSCWDEVGGCATFGCAQAPAAVKPAPARQVGGGWGDFKVCPACNTRISASLLICNCRATFPWAAPMTGDEYKAWTSDRMSAKQLKTVVTALFALSLTGVLAPLLGPLSLFLAHRGRKRLEGADGAFLALAWGNVVIGATYAVLFVLLATGH